MKQIKLGDLFEEEGGTELAPMSTTTEFSVAVTYAMSSEAVVFKVVTMNSLQRGADIQFLSAFAAESEVLFPPLTYLQPLEGRKQVIQLEGITLTVVEVQPTTA
mmetsp:Transcript_12605/g.30943  ORF Transcript_12605/g.30943 Transcript_12605/m.30943 type:complete len:104 (+) Transcript_12605:349-660(+)